MKNIKMNIKNAKDAQFFLNMLINDNYSSIYVLSGDDTNDWQFAVEFIYRLKVCDIICFSFNVLTKNKERPNTTYNGIKDFCYNLSITHPDDRSSIIWIDADLILTEFGKELTDIHLKDFDVYSGKINTKLIEHLEKIFEDNNVAWDENNPIFPVKKDL